MKKLIVQNLVSIDGYFEGPNRELDWHLIDEEKNQAAADFLDGVDTLLFGRVTYQLMESYWPTKHAIENDALIAERMNRLNKVVFSRTLDKAEWENTRLVRENAVETVRTLKQQPGKDMAIFGSSDLVVSLMNDNLIDEFGIFITPVVLGGGKPLFKGIDHRMKFALVGTKTFRSGLVFLNYHLSK